MGLVFEALGGERGGDEEPSGEKKGLSGTPEERLIRTNSSTKYQMYVYTCLFGSEMRECILFFGVVVLGRFVAPLPSRSFIGSSREGIEVEAPPPSRG